MNIAIITNDEQINELKEIFNEVSIHFSFFKIIEEINKQYDAIFDFLYDNTEQRIIKLNTLQSTIFVNSVSYILEKNTASFIRFNGWSSLLHRKLFEIAIDENNVSDNYKKILQALHIDYKIVPNIIGLITPRVISMIVNEAYYALGENVSTKEEIDIAMKLGTNYPYGPFEWSEKIGLENIYYLLKLLSNNDERYKIAPSMYLDLKINS